MADPPSHHDYVRMRIERDRARRDAATWRQRAATWRLERDHALAQLAKLQEDDGDSAPQPH